MINKPASKPNTEKKKLRLLYLLLALSIAAVVIFAAGLARELYITWLGRQYYADLASSVETRPPEAGLHRPARTPAGTARLPDAGEEGFIRIPYVDFDALGDRLPGISAWIKLEGTVLDYPVMQWTDNSYFLDHLPDGTGHRSGSVFLDYRNSADFSDKNTLIYGHQSRTGDMFDILKSYRNQSFYEDNPVIYVYTPQKDYRLELFAGYLLDSGVETPPVGFADEEAFEAHIIDIKRRSVFRSDVEVSADDSIVSLCTCAYDYTNARLIITGKLTEIYTEEG